MLFGGGSGGVVVLRLLRLARVVKIINKIPKLKMIIMGLVGGLKSIGYILLLLGLVFYMFAILGFFFFARNDPYHFGRLTSALLTLWRASTLEDWTDIMYIGIWGCKVRRARRCAPASPKKTLPYTPPPPSSATAAASTCPTRRR